METKKITDKKLLELCTHYGKLALHCRRKFICLLPEVNRRKLHERKGFGSIFEFAAKLAGVSKEQVQRVLQLDRKFENKPILREALVAGKVGANKLSRLASVATVENQKILLNQAEQLSKSAIETFVRDIKTGNQNGLFQTKEGDNSVPGHRIEDLELSQKVIAKLAELKNKGLNINELILKFLEQRGEEIENKKAEIAKKIVAKNQQVQKSSRYVQAEIRHLVREEHGTKCSIPHCGKQAKVIHHTAHFALTKNHNPYFLAPLCHEHHEIAHSLNRKFHLARAC